MRILAWISFFIGILSFIEGLFTRFRIFKITNSAGITFVHVGSFFMLVTIALLLFELLKQKE